MSNDEADITILIVEDEVLVRMHGTDILQAAGFEVLEASNADEALMILDGNGEVRLLFSDIDMLGRMDGVELARRVHERWPHIRLLLTSGHHQLREASLPSPGRFLRKPWTQEVLTQEIYETLAVQEP